MFSVKLNAPVLFRKQLPMIAEALHVDEKVLDDFLSVSAFYGVKDGKGTIVPIKKTDTIVHIDYKAYDNYYFVVDAILQYAKDIDASVTLPVITEIELCTDVFKKMAPDQLSDIVYLAKLLTRQQRPHSKAKRVECAVHSCCQRVRTPVQKGGVP